VKLVITETQREALARILATHLHNMSTEATRAHGNKDKELFYLAACARTEELIPLFRKPEKEMTDEEFQLAEDEEEARAAEDDDQ